MFQTRTLLNAIRSIHVPKNYFSSEKSALATLRKKTGYTFANCKKALELHQNNLDQAEEWLQKQAQSLGWSKATKLEGRKTSQGLIAIATEENNASLVEVNCETDFVARNEQFKNIATTAAKGCLKFCIDHKCDQDLTKMFLDTARFQEIKALDGKSLHDHLTLMIGSVGENASLKRAICMKAQHNIKISGYAHPKGNESDVLLGKYGALIAYKSKSDTQPIDENIGKHLCQHIVGMNPQKIGDKEIDKPAENTDDETCLIYQEYLLNPEITVNEVLDENCVEVVEFIRFECGEQLDNINYQQKLENIETCQ